MTLAHRIKNRRKELKLTQVQLAELAGTSQQNITNLENEKVFVTTLILPLSRALKCDPEWLESGNGNPPDKEVSVTKNYIIEVLDITASAGNGYLNSDVQEVIKLIEYDSEQARLLFNGLMSSNLKVINIKGDSMQGTFESGDALYIDVSIRSFDGDGIYVFTFGNNLYVKRLQVIKDKLIVISDNKAYIDWDISENEIDQLYIHGKVMLSQSMLLRKHG